MMWSIAELSGRPLTPELVYTYDLPHTLTAAIALYKKYQSFRELSEPVPEEWYDYPNMVERHMEKLYPSSKKSNYEIRVDEVDD